MRLFSKILSQIYIFVGKNALFFRAFCSFGNGIKIHYSLQAMFTPEDLDLFAEKGIDVHTVEEQLASFKSGFPFLRILSSALSGTVFYRLANSKRNIISICGKVT